MPEIVWGRILCDGEVVLDNVEMDLTVTEPKDGGRVMWSGCFAMASYLRRRIDRTKLYDLQLNDGRHGKITIRPVSPGDLGETIMKFEGGPL